MAGDREEFLRKLIATFRIEAEEHIEAMSSGLVALERLDGAQRARALETIYREAHSLKGAARAVNLLDVEGLCHSLEDLFAAMKADRVGTTAELFDLLLEVMDVLRQLVQAEPGAAPDARVPVLRRRLGDRTDGTDRTDGWSELPISPTSPISPIGPIEQTVRLRTSQLDSILRQTEELLGPRLASGQRAIEIREARTELAAWRKRRRAVDGEPFLRDFELRLVKLERVAEADHRNLAAAVDGLLLDVKETCMLPFSTLLEGLPRVVRDLAREHGKQVQLAIRGAEIEIDRRILEEMKAPMVHLVRNGIDHGVESPTQRQAAGKPAVATITVDIAHKNGGVEIVVGDDGAGIDGANVRRAAEKLGIDTESMSDREAAALIFQSGFSTSPVITGTSGRGLGLAIVREKVDQLAGAIDVDSEPGAGTRIVMRLPLSLATFRGVLISLSGRRFLIPSAGIQRVGRVATADVRMVENRETISIDGRTVPLVALSDVLGLPRAAEVDGAATIAVLGVASGAIAFRVDEVIAEQEVLIKGLGPQLRRVRNFAGAMVLGSGEIVPVLSVPDLMRSAIGAGAGSAPARSVPARRKSVLVVEDSITSRMLLENILEAAGYAVTVASDGVDAWTTLKSGAFDLIVSDVEMPRMDGFALTEKVRADKAQADLPVILVTALETREHRERGVDAGANAYIVKSRFDQSDLLDAVRRLIG